MNFIFISVLTILGNMAGQWNFKFGDLSFPLRISVGQLTIAGKAVQLEQSNHAQYSTAKGWLKFTYKGGWTFYIKFQAGGTIKVVAMKDGVTQTGSIFKIPSTSKYRLVEVNSCYFSMERNLSISELHDT